MTPSTDAKAVQLRNLLHEVQLLSSSIRAEQCAHLVANDVQAVEFMCKLHDSGYEVVLADAMACAVRLREAANTGVYPEHLLFAGQGKDGS